MTKNEAKKRFIDYLTGEHIPYNLLNEPGEITPLKDIDTIYLSCNIEDVIGGRIETTVIFMKEHCYCKSYFCQSVAETEERAVKAARMCICRGTAIPFLNTITFSMRSMATYSTAA